MPPKPFSPLPLKPAAQMVSPLPSTCLNTRLPLRYLVLMPGSTEAEAFRASISAW